MKNEFHEVMPGITAIKLTQGKYTLIDTKNLDIVAPYNWYAAKGRTTFYALGTLRVSKGNFEHAKMHRVLTGAPSGMDVDHWDGNGLRNLEENMRIATKRQNGQNKHIPKSSQFVGVQWRSDLNKWSAMVQFNGRQTYLGIFELEEDASAAYELACAQIEAGTFVKVYRTKLSKYVCVSYDSRRDTWYSYIKLNGKRRHLGCFHSEEEAHAAYLKAKASLGMP